MKKLIKIAVALVLVVIIVISVVIYNLNSIAKSTVEEGGSYALGVPTTVDSVNISLLGGTASVSNLNIANPPKFKTKHLLNVGTFKVEVDTGTLTSDTIVIPLIELDGASMNIEQNGSTSNMKVIADNIAKMAGSGDGKTPAEPAPKTEQEGGKKFKVGKLVIRNISATIELVNVPLIKGLTTIPIKIDEIVIDDLTDDNAGGVAMSELTRRIVPILMTAVLDKAKGIPGLDPKIFEGLTGDLGNLVGNLGEGATKMVTEMGSEVAKQVGAQAQKVAEGLTKELGKVTENLGKDVGNAVGDVTKDLGKGLGDLLGGKKDADGKTDEKKSNPLGGLGDLLGGKKDDDGKKDEKKSNPLGGLGDLLGGDKK